MPTSYCQRFTSKECFDCKLRGFEEDTMTKFVVWTKDKAFGVNDPKPGSKKIKWQLQYVPFDGIPFMVLGRRVYSCHLGVDKHKHEKQKRKLQLIPDDIHKQRKESSGHLRHALTKTPSAVKFEEQYVACFPGIEEHKNHPVVGEAAEVREPVDTMVKKHIEKTALAGARKVSEVRRHVSRDSNTPHKDTSNPPRDTSVPHKDTSNPPSNTIKTVKREKCGSLLREISYLTYYLQDEPFLDSLTVRLNDLLEDVRRHTPHNDTVPLSYTPPSKKIRYLKALSMIPKKQLTSGRVGHHAEAM